MSVQKSILDFFRRTTEQSPPRRYRRELRIPPADIQEDGLGNHVKFKPEARRSIIARKTLTPMAGRAAIVVAFAIVLAATSGSANSSELGSTDVPEPPSPTWCKLPGSPSSICTQEPLPLPLINTTDCQPTGISKWLYCGTPLPQGVTVLEALQSAIDQAIAEGRADPRRSTNSPDNCYDGELYPTSNPEVSGDLHVGNTLNSTAGSWFNCAQTISYSWLWHGNCCIPTPNAYGSTYTTSSGDLGAYLWTKVTACNEVQCVQNPNDSNHHGPVSTAPSPLPTVNLTANPTRVIKGQPTSLSWSASNANSCLGTSFPSYVWRTDDMAGSRETNLLAQDTVFTWSCTNSGGTAYVSVTVTVWCGGGYDSTQDTDQDCHYNGADNCAARFNPTQYNTDSDGLGDVCDAPPEYDCEASSTCPGPGPNEINWDNATQTSGSAGDPNYEITVGNMNTWKYSLRSCPGAASGIVDPITVVFYRDATAAKSLDRIWLRTGWSNRANKVTRRIESKQMFQSWGPAHCGEYYGDIASGGAVNSRFHVRCRKTAKYDDLAGLGTTTTCTPHHEDITLFSPQHNWKWFACPIPICGRDAPCWHAVDQNGPSGSGFDIGRTEIYNRFKDTTSNIVSQNWGNTAEIPQCDGGRASSNGLVYFIEINAAPTAVTVDDWPIGPETGLVSTSPGP